MLTRNVVFQGNKSFLPKRNKPCTLNTYVVYILYIYTTYVFHIKYKNYATHTCNILEITYECNCQFEIFCIIENENMKWKHTALAFLPMSSLYTSVNS